MLFNFLPQILLKLQFWLGLNWNLVIFIYTTSITYIIEMAFCKGA